ncbi:SIR2-like domain-containing protein [Brevibacterium aurantiacum]|uniref:SIR2-like domain-containing protein n=2 Tax=Brevibacterium aurantiacum TaxID=273384 RepID=A0A2H1L029_BREAU|nr:SIR2 family protein [Brevibacterium aurantiacum]SMY05350.1 SIR2-like domain-containing protein [Brevibacterium aurantiacum]
MNQPGGADVITLNYDLTVERVTDGIIEVNRGVHSWRPGESIHFPTRDRSMNLIKVHGSLDWVVRKTPAPHGLVVSTEIVEADRNAYSSGDASAPWIVVGDRDKLGTDGPTIELNYAAREALRRTDHLAVVGYSFRDEHINTLIRDWMAGDETRTMTVLDKKWPTFSRNSRHDPADFRSQLVATYAPRVDNEGERIQSRLLPVEGTADEKLLEVLKSEPTADPKELITIEQLPE